MSFISHNIVREQYERMDDSTLVAFAEKESMSLTTESFHILKSEFEKRKLDLAVIESAEIDIQLKSATQTSEFEKNTAAAFTENIWMYAFDLKHEGKNDEEIFNSLIKKNINPEYAQMIIFSIEQRSKAMVENFGLEITVGWVFIFIGIFCLFFSLQSEEPNAYILLWGVLAAMGGAFRLYKSYDKKKKFETTLENIKKEKEEQADLYQ